MKQVRVLPHRQPSAGWVFGEWRIAVNGAAVHEIDVVDSWDYGATLSISYALRLDTQLIADSVGLGEDSLLQAYLLADCPQANVRRTATETVNSSTSGEVSIRLEIEPGVLAGSIKLHRGIVLKRPGSASVSSVSPTRPGSRLYEDEPVRVVLEGSGARFPTEPVDFSEARLEGAWHLSVLPGADPRDPFMAVAQMLLNEKHPAVASLLDEPQAPVNSVLGSALFTDTLRQMIGYAAADETYSEETDFPDESLGQVLRDAAQGYLRQDLCSLIRMRREDPARFEQVLQAGTRYLEDLDQSAHTQPLGD